MANIDTNVLTVTYDDVIIKPKSKGRVDLVINHQHARKMAKMQKKNLKKYGDSIISYKAYDEDEFCSFEIRKIKSRPDRVIFKGKNSNCETLPLPFGSTIISFAWGYDSFGKAEEAAEENLDLFTTLNDLIWIRRCN